MTSNDILFVTLDSCRYDTFLSASLSNTLPNLSSVGKLYSAFSPSYFTFGSHSCFWMGFLPGVQGSSEPILNPKAGKLFRMGFSGHLGNDTDQTFNLQGSNIIDGFRRQGYCTIGSGAVDWFDPNTETGSVLSQNFEHFYFAGNTWSLLNQLRWIDERLNDVPSSQSSFVFLNVGETHVPYWHEGADWDRWPSPCVPFGSDDCCAFESSRRQRACLQWVDTQLAQLLDRFSSGTIVVCADHGDCWGEDGLWEHGISHPATLTVPLLMRVRGKAVKTPINQRTSIRHRLRRVITTLLP